MKAQRVLIVDDDASIGALLSEVLEDLGLTVCGLETSAANAVTAAARLRPDLMIVDIGLGDVSGVSAVEDVLRHGFVRHVFVTGDSMRALSLGAGAVLIRKPFRAADIELAIQRALEGSAAGRVRVASAKRALTARTDANQGLPEIKASSHA